MAIWKDPTPAKPEPARFDPPAPAPINEPTQAAPTPTPIRAVENPARESVIAADLTIEGKIEGAGHVRIAGRFKGDVNVQGNVTIEQGAHVTGQVNAATISMKRIGIGWRVFRANTVPSDTRMPTNTGITPPIITIVSRLSCWCMRTIMSAKVTCRGRHNRKINSPVLKDISLT